MFLGAQVSLYPMSDDFVGIILGALGALDPWRDRLRLETASFSTLMVGPRRFCFRRCATCSAPRRAGARTPRCTQRSPAAVRASRTTRSAHPSPVRPAI
ncbi:MAG: YkoF family thiamine/hydroxymethylpyrimidine-binding protein [Paracoccaceae bacterium]